MLGCIAVPGKTVPLEEFAKSLMDTFPQLNMNSVEVTGATLSTRSGISVANLSVTILQTSISSMPEQSDTADAEGNGND